MQGGLTSLRKITADERVVPIRAEADPELQRQVVDLYHTGFARTEIAGELDIPRRRVVELLRHWEQYQDHATPGERAARHKLRRMRAVVRLTRRGMTGAEIARILKITKERVYQLRQEAAQH